MSAELSASWLQAHDFRVDCASRSRLLGHSPSILWFTGLPGAGKSTIANRVEMLLHSSGRLTYVLDGDSIRLGLCKDLGFSELDRHENIRRIAEVAKLMADAGVIVLVCSISPFRTDRDVARTTAALHRFAEIHVHVPVEVAEERDPKGLYRLARAGIIQNFTGISSPYEPPEDPDILINTVDTTIEHAAASVLKWLADS